MTTQKYCQKCHTITDMKISGNFTKIVVEKETVVELNCVKCGWRGIFEVEMEVIEKMIEDCR